MSSLPAETTVLFILDSVSLHTYTLSVLLQLLNTHTYPPIFNLLQLLSHQPSLSLFHHPSILNSHGVSRGLGSQSYRLDPPSLRSISTDSPSCSKLNTADLLPSLTLPLRSQFRPSQQSEHRTGCTRTDVAAEWIITLTAAFPPQDDVRGGLPAGEQGAVRVTLLPRVLPRLAKVSLPQLQPR